MRSSVRPTITAVVLCLVAAGCTRDNYIDGAKIEEIHQDAVRAKPIGWRSAQVEDERHVLLFFGSGDGPCWALGPPDIAYKEDVVEITLKEGSDNLERSVDCIGAAFEKVVRIELAEPLGEREVVDGFDPTGGID